MRISDWSSDVCSSDLLNVCDGAARWVPEPVRHDEKRVAALYQCWEIHVTPESCAASCSVTTLSASPVSNLRPRSEEHTSELQSLMRTSYAVFCLKKKKNRNTTHEKCNH